MTSADIADELRFEFRCGIGVGAWTPGIIEVEWDSPVGPIAVRSITSWRVGAEVELEADRDFRIQHAELVLTAYRDRVAEQLEQWFQL